jgi:hypothetical protein
LSSPVAPYRCALLGFPQALKTIPEKVFTHFKKVTSSWDILKICNAMSSLKCKNTEGSIESFYSNQQIESLSSRLEKIKEFFNGDPSNTIMTLIEEIFPVYKDSYDLLEKKGYPPMQRVSSSGYKSIKEIEKIKQCNRIY